MNRPSTIEISLRQQRPVVCAIDCDKLAADVLATAAVLAAQLSVPLAVVHSPDSDLFLSGEARRLALEHGNAFLDDISAGHVVDERIVVLDDPVRLVEAVAEEGASMIVIGTRRRSGLRSALLGSVSHAVIARAECPVLTVSSLTHPELRDSPPAADACGDPIGSGRRRVIIGDDKEANMPTQSHPLRRTHFDGGARAQSGAN